MTDQVANLKGERGYSKVAFINGDLNFIDRESIIKQCKDGEIDILYLSPESLLSCKRPKLREVYLPAITTFAAMIKNKDYGSN